MSQLSGSNDRLDNIVQQGLHESPESAANLLARDVQQHPQDALQILQKMSSGKEVPNGFPSAADLFGHGEGCGNGGFDREPGRGSHPQGDGQTVERQPQSSPEQTQQPQSASSSESGWQKIGSIASSVVGDVQSAVSPSSDSSSSGSSGGGFLSTVGSIAADILPFIL